MEDIKQADKGSFFLLHACAHNPTGVDPSAEQWQEMSSLMKEKGHFPFFDMAYQGFASGDCVKDAQAITIFLKDGHELGCSQSYAKNMGLYGQRVGCLSLVVNDKKVTSAVGSQVRMIARPMYSNPPIYGASLVCDRLLYAIDFCMLSAFVCSRLYGIDLCMVSTFVCYRLLYAIDFCMLIDMLNNAFSQCLCQMLCAFPLSVSSARSPRVWVLDCDAGS
jgi:hypothetical protein